MAEIMTVSRLLGMNLGIPPYQRPYKWKIRNVGELLCDINNAVADAKRFGGNFRYRIGTMILHRAGKGRFDIVDGQQRILSLVLLQLYLKPDFVCPVLQESFSNKETQNNIHVNYGFIREWFSVKPEEVRQEFAEAFKNILEVVVIEVDRVSEAFQLFDSQNTRGRGLDPHDLLKAYHLREMRNDPYEMRHAVTRWEAKDMAAIRDLFQLYLFPVWNWSRGYKSRPFTDKEIDTYKGITEDTSYPYARRAGRAMPYFQITEPFLAGGDFFEMVEHYLLLLGDIRTEICDNPDFEKIKNIICGGREGSAGFGYVKTLFWCALLCYYDKFHNFDVMAVKKLFTWAFMLRVDMENLGFDTINKYAVGEDNGRYTNVTPLFARMSLARVHTEISGLQIKYLRENGSAASEKWNDLYEELKKLNGYAEDGS